MVSVKNLALRDLAELTKKSCWMCWSWSPQHWVMSCCSMSWQSHGNCTTCKAASEMLRTPFSYQAQSISQHLSPNQGIFSSITNHRTGPDLPIDPTRQCLALLANVNQKITGISSNTCYHCLNHFPQLHSSCSLNEKEAPPRIAYPESSYPFSRLCLLACTL